MVRSSPALGGHAVADARGGGDEVEVELALQAFLDDFHVQEAEKAATKSEAQRHGVFRFVEERRVVEAQFLQGVAQRRVIARVHGVKPREDQGLDFFEARKRLGGWAVVVGDRIANLRVGDALDVGNDKSDLAGAKLLQADGLGRQDAEFLHGVNLVVRPEANACPHGDRPLHHAGQHHHAPVAVEPGIENQRLERGFRRTLRRREPGDDGFQDFLNSRALLGADQ